jgi:hypothetical protein
MTFQQEAIDAGVNGERVLYVTPQMQIADERFREIVNALEGNTDVRKVTFSSGNKRVQFFSGGEIVFTATSRHGGRGYTPDVLILDEVSPVTVAGRVLVSKTGRVVC